MYIFRKFIMTSFLLIGMATTFNLHSLAADIGRSNDINSGNRFDAGGFNQSNRNYGDNRFNNNFYQGIDNGVGNYNAPPVVPAVPYGYFGSAPEAPNSQVFPDDSQANALYWGEVQQMEQQ